MNKLIENSLLPYCEGTKCMVLEQHPPPKNPPLFRAFQKFLPDSNF